MPRFTGPFQNTLPSNPSAKTLLSGSGNPEGVVIGSPGQPYVDNDNYYLYLKVAGTQKVGWQHVGTYSETTSTTRIYYGTDTDPNGVISASRPALYYGSDGSVWVKTGDEVGTSDWTQIIAGAPS